MKYFIIKILRYRNKTVVEVKIKAIQDTINSHIHIKTS